MRNGAVARSTGAAVVEIKIVADLVCPWCYLGLRRLKRALAMRPTLGHRFVWQAFLLNPDAPPGGVPFPHYLSTKAGGDSTRLVGGVLKAAALDGISLDFSRMTTMPNSIDAHRLVRWAGRTGDPDDDRQVMLVETLLEAYFGAGEDLGQTSVLIALATQSGFDPSAVAGFLATDKDRDAVRAEHQQARGMGIKGVPCFILDGRYAISGAQEPEVFLPLLDLARTGPVI